MTFESEMDMREASVTSVSGVPSYPDLGFHTDRMSVCSIVALMFIYLMGLRAVCWDITTTITHTLYDKAVVHLLDSG